MGRGGQPCIVMVVKRTGCRIATDSWVWWEKGCVCVCVFVGGSSKSHCENLELWGSMKSGGVGEKKPGCLDSNSSSVT